MKIYDAHKRKIILLLIGLLVFVGVSIWLKKANTHLQARYYERESSRLIDRNGELIRVLPNEDGFYTVYTQDISEEIKRTTIQNEDKYFKYHFGVNPISTLGAFLGFRSGGGSTITQQLVKILLNHESDRNIKNKLEEMMYAFALEIGTTKDEILTMYLNSIFFGNQVAGVEMASSLYFGSFASVISTSQIEQLVRTISAPSDRNPWSGEKNTLLKDQFIESVNSQESFEIEDECMAKVCTFTNDILLTKKIREIVNTNLIRMSDKKVTNSAVVVFKEPEHELIAMIGSPDPHSTIDGLQINMALEPRPIGSTVKPFIYALGFERGLRPYTLVDDREYKYTTGDGFAHYPKNFDYAYRGTVSLHESLSNSLNVPAVKVLEYITLDTFEEFLLKRTGVTPRQPISTYQYGVALGQLELDLYTLTDLFSIFSNHGVLKSKNQEAKRVFKEAEVQLINKILSDRLKSIDQFGLNGNLNILQAGAGSRIALKTGTSREFHDSWVVGYTPDFVVGVWVGNTDNTAMDEVTGQIGAGTIWHDVMSYMLSTEYNKNTPFTFDQVKSFSVDDPALQGLQYGLTSDIPASHLYLMQDTSLILQPHDNDEYKWSESTRITLTAKENVHWYVNAESLGVGSTMIWQPLSPGAYEIEAVPTEGDSAGTRAKARVTLQ